MPAKSPPWYWWGQGDAGSQSPPAEYKVPGGPAPRGEEAPSFLPGELHRAVSETAPSPSLSPGGQWRFVLPSLPTTAPSTRGGGAGEGGERGTHSRDTVGGPLSPNPKGRVMREGDQWGGAVRSPALPHPRGGSHRGSHFPDGDAEAPRGGQKFPHQPFFKDENPISGFQGAGKVNPGDKGLGLIPSLSLFTLCTGGAASAGPPGPENPCLPQRARGLSQVRTGGGEVSLILHPLPHNRFP